MDDIDKTMPPQRAPIHHCADDVTIPRKKDRKTDDRFTVGDLIMNRYKILSELGQGGMGVVYKCFDETAGIEVALKALPPELSHNTLEMEDIKENFQLIHNLHHPNIASSNNLEKDKNNENYYLIMECCEGEDLRSWIRRKRKEVEIKLEDILPLLRQVADALDYAHKQNIIHRDIKPGNIMINNAGDIKVLDFGLAAKINTSMTRVSMVHHETSGTGPYMAPEQWSGKAQGAQTDQYAFAVMVYEMLTGHLPFEGSNMAVLQQAVLTQDAEDIANVPQYVQATIKRAMSKEPTERFKNCSDFVAALGGKKIKVSKIQKYNNRHNWVVLLIIATMLVTCGMGYYFFSKRQKEQNHLQQLAREKIEIEHLNQLLVKKKQEEAIARAEQEKLAKLEYERKVLIARAEQEKLAKLEYERKIAIARAEQEKLAKLEYERKAKLTEEQLDNENAVLKVELLDKIAKIKKKNYDQSQTFGQKIYDMNIAFATAKEAKLLITANKKYNEAKQLADWILQNGELREEAKNFKIKAKNNRSAAEKYEPKIYANELFQKAERFYQTAEKFYNTIKFFESKKNFDEAAKFFEQAKDKAFDNKLLFLTTEAQKAEKLAKWNELKLLARKIRSLNSSLSNQFEKKAIDELRTLAIQKELSSANKAKTAKNWRKVYYFAIATLKIDNSNIEAQNLKLEAENNLKPTLKIIAKVNGERVPARVKFGTQSMDTFYQTINDLKENSKYKGSLIWNTPNTVYVGNIEFICNWHGLKKITVSLKKQDYTTIDCKGVVLEMVKIKAGSFSMGNPESKWGRNNDEKLHRVTLTQDYWLGKFEVTQAQYESIMGNNPSHFQSKNRPVEQVCWDDAKEFCNKLNEYYADKLPIGYKFDLPTESQWEYACRAGTTTNFSYGDASDIKKMNFNGKYPYGGGLDGIFRRQTVNVGSLGYKNALGLYDMHGNVLEWCRDWYDSYTGDVTDPVGPSSGLGRVYRGGSWDHYAKSCRSANRDYEKPNYSNSNLGFRLALVPVK